MGASSSTSSGRRTSEGEDQLAINRTVWKIKLEEIMAQSGNDGVSLLMEMVYDQLGRKALTRAFSKKPKAAYALQCWIDISAYIVSSEIMFTEVESWLLAKDLFDLYVESGSPREIGLPSDCRDRLYKALRRQKKSSSSGGVPQDLLDQIRGECFDVMLRALSGDSLSSGVIASFREVSRNTTYNRLTVDDFDYFAPLGKGGFGRVVRVRKRSTGVFYAMKIMPKSKLARSFSSQRSRPGPVPFLERDMYRSCDSDFIAKMDYTLQAPDHVIMVLELVEGKRMSDVTRQHARGMSEPLLRFYVAEIALALAHLHAGNVIYRDLKLDNILVDTEGHVKLIDFGLVCKLDPHRGFPWELRGWGGGGALAGGPGGGVGGEDGSSSTTTNSPTGLTLSHSGSSGTLGLRRSLSRGGNSSSGGSMAGGGGAGGAAGAGAGGPRQG